MKLTEQQLAQIFQHNNNAEIDCDVCDLNASIEASDARLKSVEQIADNSTLSASYQVINKMEAWSKALSTDLQNQRQTNLSSALMSFLRPALATAAVITAVYFITPISEQTQQPSVLHMSQQISLARPDRIMYSSSFENGASASKEHTNNKSPDVIAKFNFS